MRTLFYHTSPHWTGASRAFAEAAQGFVARGEPVTIACRADSPAEESFIRVGLDVAPLPPVGSVGRAAWHLRKVLKEKFIEVVFLHTEREHLVAASAMRLAGRGTVIRRLPAGYVPARTRSGSIAGKMAASRLLFSTEEDRVRASVGDRAFVAPLGVDPSRAEGSREEARTLLGLRETSRLVMVVADRTARTRITTALRTASLLAERHEDLHFGIVGSGGDDDDTHMHASALGISSIVTFLGERDDMPFLLSAADLGWVAAEGDDAAFGCLDFMAARVPVVAERSTLISHYVPDGIAGVMLAPGDASDTAAVVAQFLADDAQRAAMGNAGYTRAARDFTAKAMIDGFDAAADAAGERASRAGR